MVVVITALMISMKSGLSGKDVVATVNGEPISLNEFKSSIVANKALVYGYFKSKYNADDSKEFWTTNFNGEIPLEKIKKDVMYNCVKIRSKLIMAKQKKIIEDITYEKFLKDLIAENKRRKAAIKEKQVIYGPLEYGELEYYGVVNSNVSVKLEEVLTKDLVFTEEEMKKYYDDNKEKIFKIVDDLKIVRISAIYLSADKITKLDAKKLMINIKKNIDAGIDIETATRDPRVKVEDQILDPKGTHSYLMTSPVLISNVMKLNSKEVTEVIDESGAFNIAKCIQRTRKGYQEFSDAKESIRRVLAKSNYDADVEKQRKDADVIVNSKIYESIGVKYIN